eukprot:CAMPEP_0118809370 /NCGR_PEP_ID=MMETSP1162-20130426/229_1 /TAXON_ID=33656 /ORGANISM="Phaeocystis Sp, Strain CCMP2710" /LENGTH=79 /DNA_ID=CAMNT_0006738799 /DNA_START=812 /DNA_END=1052 /DNA_ORIENTATION=-
MTILKVDFPVDAESALPGATNSKAGLSVTELQPQTSVGHPNLPRRSDFRVLDEMQNHAACHAHAQPPHCPILGSCRSRV